MHLRFILTLLFCVTSSARAEMFTTDKSEVYPYGNSALAKPNVLVLDGATVTLNGVLVFPTVTETAPSQPTRNASAHTPVYEGMEALQRQMERDGYALADITPRLVEYVHTQAVVDSVTGVGEGWFWVWWNDSAQPEKIIVTCSNDPPTRQQLAEQMFDLFKMVLEHDCILIISSRGNFCVPSQDERRRETVRQEIALASSLVGVDRPAFAQHWNNRIIPAGIAYQFSNPIPLSTARRN